MDDATGQASPQGKSKAWQAAYLRAYARTGNKTTAARYAGVSRITVWRLERESEEFRDSVAHALDEYADYLERVADRRAARGYLEPVFYKGDRCGERLRFSDALLILRLKALRPEKYRDNYQGDDDEREVYIIEPPRRMSDDSDDGEEG